MKTSIYSKETKTVIKLFEQLTTLRRKRLLEKVQELILDQESDTKWDILFENSPEQMMLLAKNALKEHRQGKSKPFKL